MSWSSTATPVATLPPEDTEDVTEGVPLARLMNWTLFEFTPARVTMAKPSAGSRAMLLGADKEPKESNGVAGPLYIFGGTGGGGDDTGFKLNGLLLRSKGGFVPP